MTSSGALTPWRMDRKSRLETILMMGKGLGMRASEMLSSTAGWITQRRIGNESVTIIEVIGKGDKVRRLPLQQEHLDAFNAYLKIRGFPRSEAAPREPRFSRVSERESVRKTRQTPSPAPGFTAY